MAATHHAARITADKDPPPPARHPPAHDLPHRGPAPAPTDHSHVQPSPAAATLSSRRPPQTHHPHLPCRQPYRLPRQLLQGDPTEQNQTGPPNSDPRISSYLCIFYVRELVFFRLPSIASAASGHKSDARIYPSVTASPRSSGTDAQDEGHIQGVFRPPLAIWGILAPS